MQLSLLRHALVSSASAEERLFPESAEPHVTFSERAGLHTVEIPHAANTTYLSHGYFRYIGKYPPQLVADILNRYEVAGRILDPMCGGGTTLTEASLRGIDAVGIDVNPVSRAVSTLAATPLPADALDAATGLVIGELNKHGDDADAPWSEKLSVYKDPLCVKYLDERTRRQIAQYLKLLNGVQSDLKVAFEVALYAVLRHVSRANIKKMNLEIDDKKKVRPFIPEISAKLLDICDRNREYSKWARPNAVRIIDGSAEATAQPDASFDAVFLHPPYLTNTAFCEFTQLQLSTIGVDHKSIWRKELRCRGSFLHEPNGLKKYLVGWARILKEASRVLKPGGVLVSVVGDGQIDYVRIPVGKITEEFAADCGLRLEEYYFHVLNNHTGQTQSRKMKGQHVSIFRRGDSL